MAPAMALQLQKNSYVLVHIIHTTTATLISQGTMNVVIFIEDNT